MTPTPPLTANEIAGWSLAGLVVGQLIVVGLDAVIGGPGPFVLFGL